MVEYGEANSLVQLLCGESDLETTVVTSTFVIETNVVTVMVKVVRGSRLRVKGEG